MSNIYILARYLGSYKEQDTDCFTGVYAAVWYLKPARCQTIKNLSPIDKFDKIAVKLNREGSYLTYIRCKYND